MPQGLGDDPDRTPSRARNRPPPRFLERPMVDERGAAPDLALSRRRLVLPRSLAAGARQALPGRALADPRRELAPLPARQVRLCLAAQAAPLRREPDRGPGADLAERDERPL